MIDNDNVQSSSEHRRDAVNNNEIFKSRLALVFQVIVEHLHLMIFSNIYGAWS